MAARFPITWAFVDDAPFFSRWEGHLVGRAAWRLARRLPGQARFGRYLEQVATDFCPDIVIVVKGAHIDPKVLERIKARTRARFVNYATDDPFNLRNSTPALLASIPIYDLYASPRRANLGDLTAKGARRVAFVRFGYKPGLHFPEAAHGGQGARFDADLAFIGGCDETRALFVEEILRRMPRLKLALYGGYWDRSRLFRSFYRGFAVGRDFRLAVSGARIVLNLVRRANRDGHVMRTFEVPACGGCMLAERTQEQLELFEDGREAVFFDDVEEMVARVEWLLKDESARQRIALAGLRRVRDGRHTYEDRLHELLSLAEEILA